MNAALSYKIYTSFLVLSSSELKLLSNRAKNKLRTIKFPITKVGRNTAKHVPGPWDESYILKKIQVNKDLLLTSVLSALMQSQSGSIHSPQSMRKIIIKEWKKSVKFHLKQHLFNLNNKLFNILFTIIFFRVNAKILNFKNYFSVIPLKCTHHKFQKKFFRYFSIIFRINIEFI